MFVDRNNTESVCIYRYRDRAFIRILDPVIDLATAVTHEPDHPVIIRDENKSARSRFHKIVYFIKERVRRIAAYIREPAVMPKQDSLAVIAFIDITGLKSERDRQRIRVICRNSPRPRNVFSVLLKIGFPHESHIPLSYNLIIYFSRRRNMNELCMIIKDMVVPNFMNIRTSIRTYDRDALCCGAPCWRWAYHAVHSADKWFINPCVYEEPAFHKEGLDNPDKPCDVVLSDEQLLEYLDQVEKKTLDYLDTLTDDMLYECPENCEHTRMELVLRQFRHISFHTGMLNGQTALATGEFPMWVSQADKYVDDGILFGRYRKGQVTK